MCTQTQRAWVVVGVALALLTGMAGAADFLVAKSDQTYSTIQAAVDAARAAGAGTHTVRIMDSGTYSECVVLNNSAFNSINLTIEAASGQTPKLHSFRTSSVSGISITAMPGLTLRRLHFYESLLGAQTPTALSGALEIGLGGRFTGHVTVESCTFSATATTAWANGIYIRMNNAAYKVTVTSCSFNLSASAQMRGIETQSSQPNLAGLEVSDCVFIGSPAATHIGIRDQQNATTGMAALFIHNNLFHGLVNGYGNISAATVPTGHITIENNSFVKCGGASNSHGSITITGRTTPTAIIKDNLVVDGNVNTYDGIVAGATAVTDWDADYNAFVNMKGNYVGHWGSAQKTVTDLNNLVSADNNQLNDTLTPAQLFVNYGGTDYRNDYTLKSGVWALKAASDGSFVGAFAPPSVAGTVISIH